LKTLVELKVDGYELTDLTGDVSNVKFAKPFGESHLIVWKEGKEGGEPQLS